MQMYICLECGHMFEEGEERAFEMYGQEGMTYLGCPKCYGAYEKLDSCKICERFVHPDEIYDDICHDCAISYPDADMCFEIGKADPKQVELNGFIASAYTPEQINKAMLAMIKLLNKTEEANEKFAMEDIYWYIDHLNDLLLKEEGR